MDKKELMIKEQKRHKRAWKVLVALLQGFLHRKFNLECEECTVEGPCIVIPNHASNWDALLVAMSFKKKQIYFVASEHIMRWGFVSKLLEYFIAPIAKRKAAMGSDTVMTILRRIRAGSSVCLFAEGEATWNGLSNKVFPATGKLVRSSGASLVTYRLEGVYMADPRWGRKVRRGKVRGRIVNVYSPQQLKTMTPQQINEIINADIFENAWERQQQEQISYKGKNLAEGMERGLFLCPKCKKVGTLRTAGDRISCSCGLELSYLDTGLFSPAEPFPSFYEWDSWQHEVLKSGDYVKGENELFSDDPIRLVSIKNHEESHLFTGKLRQLEDRLVMGSIEFLLEDIRDMDIVNTHKMLFKTNDDYYQIQSDHGACLRKYLAFWKNSHNKE